jgi:TonB family protein
MLGMKAFTILVAALPQLVTPAPSVSGLPPGVLQKLQVLDVYLRLTVAPTGAVEGCRPINSSGFSSFDANICEAMKVRNLDPAKDSAGNPIYAVVEVHFQWSGDGTGEQITLPTPDVDLTIQHMPSGAPDHPATELAVVIDQNGNVESCEVAKPSGAPALDAVACKAGVEAAGLRPAIDKAGAKMRSVQSLVVGFNIYTPAIFQRDPRFAALGQAGPYFPERAQRLNVAGYAVLQCASAPDGVLSGCLVKEETPKGFGFGIAGRKMAEQKWMRAAPGSGDKVLIRVDFPPSGNFRM